MLKFYGPDRSPLEYMEDLAQFRAKPFFATSPFDYCLWCDRSTGGVSTDYPYCSAGCARHAECDSPEDAT